MKILFCRALNSISSTIFVRHYQCFVQGPLFSRIFWETNFLCQPHSIWHSFCRCQYQISLCTAICQPSYLIFEKQTVIHSDPGCVPPPNFVSIASFVHTVSAFNSIYAQFSDVELLSFVFHALVFTKIHMFCLLIMGHVGFLSTLLCKPTFLSSFQNLMILLFDIWRSKE